MGLTFGTDLSGKVAVVTGAGGVLCGMFARTLSEAGAAVALLDINEEAAAKAADEITRLGGRAVAYRADVMDKEELERPRQGAGPARALRHPGQRGGRQPGLRQHSQGLF